MAKRKSLNTIIKGTVYPFDAMFSFNEKNKNFKKTMRLYEPDESDHTLNHIGSFKVNRARTVMFPSNRIYVRFNFIPETPEQWGQVAHEIFHVVEFYTHQDSD